MPSQAPPEPPPDPVDSTGEVRRLQAAHAAAVAALQTAIRDTTRLTRLLTILGDPAPLEVLLDRVLSTLSELFSSDVVVLLRSCGEEGFKPLAAIGIPEDLLLSPFLGAEGSPLLAASRGEGPTQTQDALSDPAVDPKLRDLGVRTAVWLPVMGDKGLAAVLLLARCRPLPYPTADLNLLAAMAYRIAVVLERARNEQLLLEARDALMQAERLALAGKIAGLVAHELNNPLACVQSNLNQLRQHVPVLSEALRAAREAARHLERQPSEAARSHARALRAALRGHEGLAGDVEEIVVDSMAAARRIGRLMASFGRLASADRRVDPERLDVQAAIAECVADLPPDTGRPDLVVEPDPGTPVEAWISPMVLKMAVTGMLRVLLAPGMQRADRSRPVAIRAERHEDRPAIVVSDPGLVISEEERRAIFDPRMEVVETPGGRTVAITLLATLSYQLLRGAGADLATTADGGRGLTIRILLPAPPEGSRAPS